MPTALSFSDAPPWLKRLSLPAYNPFDAARYAGVEPRDLMDWQMIAGYRHGSLHAGNRVNPLSYYELIEVAFVAIFLNLGLSFRDISNVRAHAARALGSDFPFVLHRWKTEGARVLSHVPGLERDFVVRKVISENRDGKIGWGSLVDDWFGQFDYHDSDYHDGFALVWHLVRRGIPVSIDPRVSFGVPTVHGIPTSILKGRWDSGESVRHLTIDYSLSRDDVLHGLRFEGVTDPDLAESH